MYKVKSFVVALTFLAIPSITSAQASLQSESTNQQATAGSQNTGVIQNTTGTPLETEKSSEVLSKNQPRTLGVVSNPEQKQPSVVVGAANTTNQAGQGTQTSINYLPFVVMVVAFLALITGYLSYRSDRDIDTKKAVKEEVEPTPTPKKSNKKGTKKKKAHR